MTPLARRVLDAAAGGRVHAQARPREGRSGQPRRHRRPHRRGHARDRGPRRRSRSPSARPRFRAAPSCRTGSARPPTRSGPCDAGGSAPVTLLEGVTGSGKTEVYFEAVAEAVRHGRQALILMPEIALTAQFLDRFAARFGVRPATWHSGVTGRRRERLHAGVAAGEVKVVAGARSALFLPFRDARPHRRRRGARGRLQAGGRRPLPRPRHGGGARPDRRGRRSCSPRRRRRSRRASTWSAGATAHLAPAGALRRPAHAADPRRRSEARGDPEGPLALADPDLGDGGHARARRAGAPLPQPPRLRAADAVPRLRPPLRMPELLRLARRAPLPPRARVPPLRPCRAHPACLPRLRQRSIRSSPAGRASSASPRRWRSPFRTGAPSCCRATFPGGTERLRAELAAIAAGEFDIVVGTQLVAKGHNFPQLTLVGVLDADIGLTSGDPRAAERTFQLLQQVTGRAGRGEKPGRALVQTWQPDHPGHRGPDLRRRGALLPGGDPRPRARRPAALRPARRAHRVGERARGRGGARPRHGAGRRLRRPASTVLGPAEAPLALIRGRYRFRLLVKTEREVDLQAYLRAWLARCPKVAGQRPGLDRRRPAELPVSGMRPAAWPFGRPPDMEIGSPAKRTHDETVHCIRHGQSTFNAAYELTPERPAPLRRSADRARTPAGCRGGRRRARRPLRAHRHDAADPRPPDHARDLPGASVRRPHPGRVPPPGASGEQLRRRPRARRAAPAISRILTFGHLEDIWWHRAGEPDARGIVHRAATTSWRSRVRAFRTWLGARPERLIAVVGHGTFFYHLTGRVLRNCEIVSLEL